jgi:hypothetical protein
MRACKKTEKSRRRRCKAAELGGDLCETIIGFAILQFSHRTFQCADWSIQLGQLAFGAAA